MPPNITKLEVNVTCRRCGGGLTVVNPGGTCGSESKIVVACVDCGVEWVVLALMRPPRPGRHAPGTSLRADPQVQGRGRRARRAGP